MSATATATGAPVVELVDVSKRFGHTLAVNDVSLTLRTGATIGLVGESGCGKSTTARLIVGLEEPTGGERRIKGEPYPRELRDVRRQIGFVFQDPYDSLDPRFTVAELVAEPLRAHGAWNGDGPDRVGELLVAVGLDGISLDARATELSGGQLQRVGIARALALDPELLICDEPTSALDVSVQAQILNLLLAIQAERGLACLLISHDIEVVRRLADEIVVMYAGAVMERGPADEIVGAYRHPYTEALLSSIPALTPSDRKLDRRVRLRDDPGTPQSGCPFAGRCPKVEQRCRDERPELVGDGHRTACFFPVG